MLMFEGHVQVQSADSNNTGFIRRDLSGLSLDAQDASSNLRGLRGLFAANDVQDGAQGAQKRRKLASGHAAPVQNVHLDEERSIVLAEVSLHLVSVYELAPSCKYGRLT
jgi:hypothetical protein